MATFICRQGDCCRDVQLYLETILSCRKVMTVLAVFFLFCFFLLLEIVEPQGKKKKRKKGKAEQGTEAGELCDTVGNVSFKSIHHNRMRISLFRENRRSVRLKSCEIGQQA